MIFILIITIINQYQRLGVKPKSSIWLLFFSNIISFQSYTLCKKRRRKIMKQTNKTNVIRSSDSDLNRAKPKFVGLIDRERTTGSKLASFFFLLLFRQMSVGRQIGNSPVGWWDIISYRCQPTGPAVGKARKLVRCTLVLFCQLTIPHHIELFLISQLQPTCAIYSK